ncbi:MAG: hypothetical protein IPI68_11420 [Chitinophagaceae bacterium]|nr:hypothetical protein [Chitinophagaceae bacterium]
MKEPGPSTKFVANNALFSYIQVGVPLKSNWGLSFGLRPMSRISYKIFRDERLKDPITGLPIDSASTRFEGEWRGIPGIDGNRVQYISAVKSRWPEEKLSVGLNVAYLFGSKDYNTKRSLINDTVSYTS